MRLFLHGKYATEPTTSNALGYDLRRVMSITLYFTYSSNVFIFFFISSLITYLLFLLFVLFSYVFHVISRRRCLRLGRRYQDPLERS